MLGPRSAWRSFLETGDMPAESAFAVGGWLGDAFRLGSRVHWMREVAAMLPLGPLPSTRQTRADGARPHLRLGGAHRSGREWGIIEPLRELPPGARLLGRE